MILLVRHAKAAAEHELGDWARGLTTEGRAEFRRHAQRLTGKVRLQGIATSPYVRAAQTAEILADVWSVDDVQVRIELAPAKDVGNQIANLADELGAGWALVGHNPSLEEAATRALELSEWPLKLKKGAAVALRWEGGAFAFAWQASPEQAPIKHLGIKR